MRTMLWFAIGECLKILLTIFPAVRDLSETLIFMLGFVASLILCVVQDFEEIFGEKKP